MNNIIKPSGKYKNILNDLDVARKVRNKTAHVVYLTKQKIEKSNLKIIDDYSNYILFDEGFVPKTDIDASYIKGVFEKYSEEVSLYFDFFALPLVEKIKVLKGETNG